MSWLFSRALVAEYSAASSSAGAQSALLSVSPMPQAFLPSDRMTAFSRPSRFGMTFGPLMESLGEELLMWFLAGFRAKTSASLEAGPELTASEADSGQKWRGSLAKYDPFTRSWKTAQHSLLGGSDEFSETWPRWGTTVDGELYLLPTPRHLTGASASGLWQTPVADDAMERREGKWNSRGEPKLSAEVKLWPTPCARDYRGVFRTERGLQRRAESKRGIPLNEAAGGLLNPMWVEWLMGWPLGWTELEPLATDKYRNVQRLRGVA